jgi:hypothetical protein
LALRMLRVLRVLRVLWAQSLRARRCCFEAARRCRRPAPT